MSTSSLRSVAALLILSFFHIEGVSARGRGKGVGDTAGDASDTGSDLGLSGVLQAVFAMTIVIAVLTLYQLGTSLKRFKSLQLPDGEPTLPYDVGILFRILLTSYTVMFTLNNALYAAFIASFGGRFFLPDGFQIGMVFTGQFSTVLFYATLLSIIAYRQRIQLNPSENLLNLKTFLDGWLLATILILGVAQDGLAATATSRKDFMALSNLGVAYDVFAFMASLNVAISSFMARIRLSRAGVQDKIINISAFAVSPTVLAGGIFGIIDLGIQRNAGPYISDGLFISYIVISGIVSIATIAWCLHMGAPPKPIKSDDKGVAVEKKV